MKFRFAHFADIHLRRSQYGHEWRGEDFRDAWLDQVDRIVEEKRKHGLDFVTFGGDLFEKAEPRATPFSQALEGFKRLKDAEIPVVGIKGNHDIEYPGQNDCWLDLLADEGWLKLLNSNVNAFLDEATCPDYYYPFLGTNDVVIYGIPYSGHATVSDMVNFSETNYPRQKFTILLMHAGLEGILPGHQTGTFKLEEARQLLKPKVDLLLLGHIHKPYQIDNWIYNPGSFEACDSKQAKWQDRGILIFEINTETKTHTVSTIRHPNRHWVFVEIDTTGKEPNQISLEYLGQVGNYPMLAERIVHVTLTGQMDFPMSSLDFSSRTTPKLLLPQNNTYKTVQVIERTQSSRDKIELEVFGELVGDATLVQKVMHMALANEKPEKILGEIE